MSIKDHPDYEAEVERLDYTKTYIQKILATAQEYRNEYKADIKEAMKELDFLDSSQSYIRILINSNLMDQVNENYDSLSKVQDKPYFARVDFKKDGADEIEKLYIGKTSLYQAEDESALIIDWRAPIASIYYEGRLGEVEYETEVGSESGEISLKRQFSLEDGQLTDMMDIDITTNDAFLQSSLDVNADNKLKDIASTIQGEQNQVIRAEIDQPLIVQGVAGSGKTTIALHRIAYLIYTYEDSFDPDNFMIITPNKLFIDYISDVLPELGVEDVAQTTFIDFMDSLIKSDYQLRDADDKLTKLIASDQLSNQEKDLITWASTFKGSLKFKAIIDRYLADLARSYLPQGDFKLGEFLLFSEAELNDLFLNQLEHLPFEKRVPRVENMLANKVKLEKDKALKKVKDDYDKQIRYIYYSVAEEELETKRPELNALMKERDQKIEAIKDDADNIVKDYIDSIKKLSLFEHYKKLFTKDLISKYSKEDIADDKLEYLLNYSQDILAEDKFELEDYAAIAYLKYKIFGFEKKFIINNVIMDEAQDYSPFQFLILKEILDTDMFTILGDLAQGIHSYRGISQWDKIRYDIFEQEASYRTLTQSYRTTIEVMDFANQIIKSMDNSDLVLAKPVIRHGKKPEVKTYQQEDILSQRLGQKLTQLEQEDYKSIALICKTVKECKRLKKQLAQVSELKIDLIENKDDSYGAGIVILPSYLAKGLEFDVVMIVNLTEKYDAREVDLKLLYVAMTRTLHQLYIYQQDQSIAVLEQIDDKYYNQS